MGRVHVDVAVPALALRRADAAASLGVSVEIFDEHVRPYVPICRVGSVRVFPVAGLRAWLSTTAEAAARGSA